jgi:DNA polymerase III epsilon subunit-like protein
MNQSVHWNGHLLCAIDIETTGLNPKEDQILELAILPLTPDLEPRKDILPFEVLFSPRDVSQFKKDQVVLPGLTLAELILYGLDEFTIGELLEQWFLKLNLPEKKKIMPLGHNYLSFDMPFLKEVLGPANYDYFFDFHTRDTMTCSLMFNDMADFQSTDYPFPKHSLTYLCSQLRITNHRPHRALADCVATAAVYKRMIMGAGANLVAGAHLLIPQQNDVPKSEKADRPT